MALLAAACSSSDPAASGPLGPRENLQLECVPVPAGRALTDGFDEVTSNAGTLTIERISLARPVNLGVVGALVVPWRANSSLVGWRLGFPPDGRSLWRTGVRGWSQRTSAIGAKVRHGEPLNTVVGLRITGHHATGRTAGLVIAYRDAAGHQYVWTSNVHVIMYTERAPSGC